MSIATKENNGDSYKWAVLGFLWVAFLLNQADRQVFNVVLPLIRDDLHLSDISVGWIATIFNLFYAVLVPVGGMAGDIFSRKWIVTLSLLFWSVATMLTGFASGFLALVILRSIATGGGEAFFGPSNYSLLAQYHDKTRAFAMSVHQTAYYIGVIVSGYVAGYIGQKWGWQYAFYVFGSIGVVWAVIMMFGLKDKPLSKQEAVAEGGTPSRTRIWDGFKVVFTTPTALVLTLGFGGLIFVLTGYLTWMPTYLYEKFNQSLAAAGFNSMFYTHMFAFIGVLIAGGLSDRIARKAPWLRMAMQGVGLLLGAPFIFMMGNSEIIWVVYVGLAGFGFMRALFDANTYTVLYDVTPERLHSSASGAMIMVGFGFGSLAPVVLGAIKEAMSLSAGISVLAVIWVVCGVMMTGGAKLFYRKDYDKIHKA